MMTLDDMTADDIAFCSIMDTATRAYFPGNGNPLAKLHLEQLWALQAFQRGKRRSTAKVDAELRRRGY